MAYIKVGDVRRNESGFAEFVRFWSRALKGELFVGLWLVLKEFFRAKTHAKQYPSEMIPLSSRYRAIHKLKRLLDSGEERCIGCGLCEKICPAHCIRMETFKGEDDRKKIGEYTINFGRCIFCGLCAEVCPELAITHGDRIENTAEQRALFSIKNDMLAPKENAQFWEQSEWDGFGSVSKNADEKVRKTPNEWDFSASALNASDISIKSKKTDSIESPRQKAANDADSIESKNNEIPTLKEIAQEKSEITQKKEDQNV